jgi:hypothetical protein
MSVAFHQAQKQKYRVTIELEVLNDFDPHNLDWEKIFGLEPAEKVSAYVEDLSTPDEHHRHPGFNQDHRDTCTRKL